MSTDIAEPSPKFQLMNEALYMWIEMTSAGLGAEVPKSTNGVVKSLNVHRNSNGQLRQIEMMTSAKKLLCPISQNDGRLVMPSTLCSSSFTRPLLYWNMN